MTSPLANTNLPSRDGAQGLSLDGLLGGWPRPAEPPWLTERRTAHLAAFLGADRAFGRYSRMRLDLARMAPSAPRYEVLADIGHGSASAPVGTRVDSLRQALSGEAGESLGHLLKARTPWDNLVLAGWREGLTLSWPCGKETTGTTEIRFANPGGLVLTPVVVDVAPGQEANLFLRWAGGEEPAFHATSLLGRVGDGASLRVFLLHEGGSAHHHLSSAMDLGRDSKVEVFGAWLGGRWTVARSGADLPQPGAQWHETHLVLASGKEHLDLDTQVRLSAHHTRCDVMVKTVSMGDSRAVFTGNLLMEPAATQSEAYLGDHTLLLSQGARADSVPGLEIKAADIKAAHAASMGQVDEEQMFYLMSRGLDEGTARHLLVVGFLESLLDRAPLPSIIETLAPLLEEKVRA